MPTSYVLSSDEHKQIRRDITQAYLRGTLVSGKPTAIILGGQPGAGKSGLKFAAEDELKDSGGVVIVDTDELRVEHPAYRGLTKTNDRTAADLVHEDAGQWADELTRDAIRQRRNLVIDGTLKTPEKARTLCKQLRDEGYEVDVRALAAAKEDSTLGVYMRYEEQKSRGMQARWVPELVREEAYAGLPKTLDTLERGRYVDRITVYKRGEQGPILIHSGRGAARALEKERNRERTPEELVVRDKAWNHKAASPKDEDAGLMQRIQARDPQLSEPENLRAAEFAAKARDKAQGKITPEVAKAGSKLGASSRRRDGVVEGRDKAR